MIVLLANFCFGLWNVYSNLRQEAKQAGYDKRQEQILKLLEESKQQMEEYHGPADHSERD